jgi:hypothetical protein
MEPAALKLKNTGGVDHMSLQAASDNELARSINPCIEFWLNARVHFRLKTIKLLV